jgi:hypothetical protein
MNYQRKIEAISEGEKMLHIGVPREVPDSAAESEIVLRNSPSSA